MIVAKKGWLMGARAMALAAGTTFIMGASTAVLGVVPPTEPPLEEATAPGYTDEALSQRIGGVCPQDLQVNLDRILARPQFATASWGVFVQPLIEEVNLYTHRSEALLIPASNIKLLTTAAALQIIAERRPQALAAYREEFDIINRHSNNYRADRLLKTIGGQRAVNQALESLGINSGGYQQADGSGLSRLNRAQPEMLVALLKAMYETDDSRIFYDSLPVSGINGTLRNRFRNTPVQGRVHAKTGTLNGVRALSGYVETAGYGTVAFSIVVNQPGQSGSVMLGAIDDMVLQIAQVQPCR